MNTHLNRRQFLSTAAGALGAAGCARLDLARPAQPPFRVLYSNDTTNILTCNSPWHKKGESFRPEMLEASVDEVAGRGVEAQLLQPGVGWVPWWQSKVYPPAEHYRWLKQTYGVEPDSFGRYVLGGGDLVQLFIARCRRRGQAAFISLRLNDGHHKEWAPAKLGDKISSGAGQGLCKFYCAHLDYRIGPDWNDWAQRVQNWAIPEVRAYKFALIQELCENYDLDGFELDFMRFYSLFQLDKTTREQRCAIVTGFVRQVRALLDRTARGGRRRWLCARVPCYLSALDPLGLDLPALVAVGLDMVNVSASYFTIQQCDFAAIRRQVPQAAVYLELCHSIWNGQRVRAGYDGFLFRRATPAQMYTAAHLAYARGAAGVSAFNFVYYREYGGPERGPFGEPPFEVFEHLGDRAWLARQPQHYFLASGWGNPFAKPNVLPRKLKADQQTLFPLDLAPPAGGWQRDGRLRIQCKADLDTQRFTARLNGMELVATADLAEHGLVFNPVLLGTPATLRGWTVPAHLLRDGVNQLEVKLNAGTPIEIAYLDVELA
jgi:hypothetical protein